MIIFYWLIIIIGQVYGYLISFSLYIVHIPCLLMGVGEKIKNECEIPHGQIAKLHIINVILLSFQINYNLQVAQIFVKLSKTKFLLVT
jgi:hypothetical protein